MRLLIICLLLSVLLFVRRNALNTEEVAHKRLPLIAHISCQSHMDRWPQIRASMEKQGIVDYVIVYGDPTLKTLFLKKPDNVLVVRSGDAYCDLTEKILTLFQTMASTEFGHYSGLVKVDDDAQFHDGFKKAISSLHGDYVSTVIHTPSNDLHSMHRGYHKNRCPGSTWNNKKYTANFPESYAFGGIYYLSRRALSIIKKDVTQNKPYYTDTEVYEDVNTAKLLAKYNIKPTISSELKENVTGFDWPYSSTIKGVFTNLVKLIQMNL